MKKKIFQKNDNNSREEFSREEESFLGEVDFSIISLFPISLHESLLSHKNNRVSFIFLLRFP